MNARDKKKYEKLAAQSVVKKVPKGWVYVGKGGSLDYKFGESLIKLINSEWNPKLDGYSGLSSGIEYACPIKVWEEKTGLSAPSFQGALNLVETKKSKNKTVLEFFEDLPSPYKEMAIYQANKQEVGNETSLSLLNAIGRFNWGEGEDYDFWAGVEMAIECGYDYPTIPDRTKEKVLEGFLPDYSVKLHKEDGMEVECQVVSREKTVELALEILKFYGYDVEGIE